MSESDQVAETEAPEAQPAADAIGAEETPADPAAGVDVANDPEIQAAEEELLEEAIPVALPPVAGRQAKVFLCERGHRTLAVWSAPSTCRAHVSRRAECGRPLYPIGELPEQVQKALNPLKASKKASKG